MGVSTRGQGQHENNLYAAFKFTPSQISAGANVSNLQKHHYVSRFYLDAWAGSDGKLGYYKRVKSKLVYDRISPRSTAYDVNLYATRNAKIDERNSIEEALSLIETKASATLRLMHDSLDKLTPEHRIFWSAFLIALMMRHPKGISNIEELFHRTMDSDSADTQKRYEAIRQPGNPLTFVEYVNAKVPGIQRDLSLRVFARAVADPELIKAIGNKPWTIRELSDSVTNHEFLTSDRPLLTTSGLAMPDCLIALPVGPRHAFLATHNPDYFGLADNQLVRFLNEQVVSQAVQYIYSNNDSQTRYIERNFTLT
jgi:Protein of unknown function (DUF4238)